MPEMPEVEEANETAFRNPNHPIGAYELGLAGLAYPTRPVLRKLAPRNYSTGSTAVSISYSARNPTHQHPAIALRNAIACNHLDCRRFLPSSLSFQKFMILRRRRHEPPSTW